MQEDNIDILAAGATVRSPLWRIRVQPARGAVLSPHAAVRHGLMSVSGDDCSGPPAERPVWCCQALRIARGRGQQAACQRHELRAGARHDAALSEGVRGDADALLAGTFARHCLSSFVQPPAGVLQAGGTQN